MSSEIGAYDPSVRDYADTSPAPLGRTMSQSIHAAASPAERGLHGKLARENGGRQADIGGHGHVPVALPHVVEAVTQHRPGEARRLAGQRRCRVGRALLDRPPERLDLDMRDHREAAGQRAEGCSASR